MLPSSSYPSLDLLSPLSVSLPLSSSLPLSISVSSSSPLSLFFSPSSPLVERLVLCPQSVAPWSGSRILLSLSLYFTASLALWTGWHPSWQTLPSTTPGPCSPSSGWNAGPSREVQLWPLSVRACLSVSFAQMLRWWNSVQRSLVLVTR